MLSYLAFQITWLKYLATVFTNSQSRNKALMSQKVQKNTSIKTKMITSH